MSLFIGVICVICGSRRGIRGPADRSFVSLARAIAFLLVISAPVSFGRDAAVAVVEAIAVPGATLKGNPLGDPTARRVAVISPGNARPEQALPIIYYLPGWGGSSEDFLRSGGPTPFSALAQELAVRVAVVDGRTRWGGSQFLNSTALGNYADYVSDEVVRIVEARYPLAPGRRLIAGHSSGGYGALLLAMRQQQLFAGVVALSPDSDFESTHRGLVGQPAIRRTKRSEVESWMPPATARPDDGLVSLICGLCANYAPLGAKQPGRFGWLYDERGAWQQDVWQRWLDADPLTLIRKNPKAFAPAQRVYLDGAEHDEFLANIGARNLHAALRDRPASVTFYESPGGHSDRLPERLARGVKWALDR